MPASQGAPGRSAVPSAVVLRTPDGTGITVHAFPRTMSFFDDIERAWAAETDPANDDRPLSDRSASLQTLLRRWYPRVSVQQQDGTARISEHDLVWYVYREGRMHRQDDRLDALHVALHRARRTGDDNATAMEDAREAMGAATAGQQARKAKRDARAASVR